MLSHKEGYFIYFAHKRFPPKKYHLVLTSCHIFFYKHWSKMQKQCIWYWLKVSHKWNNHFLKAFVSLQWMKINSLYFAETPLTFVKIWCRLSCGLCIVTFFCYIFVHWFSFYLFYLNTWSPFSLAVAFIYMALCSQAHIITPPSPCLITNTMFNLVFTMNDLELILLNAGIFSVLLAWSFFLLSD